ncbi:tetratricopeptide repeat protein [Roseococcus sp. DSY-14]|uniref:tetratricopeptide repeat protein n=1 Tax=Roseococcus sp. DSY-14 TaxID=3369650 RepID=UPI00387A9A24
MRMAGKEERGRIAAWARQGHVAAQLLHAQALLDAGDAAGAFAWFGIAAATGDAAALNMLGRCHECGWGTPRDDAQAEPLYRRAAAAGLDWAQYNLGGALARRGAMAEALRWYRAAAAQGHAKALNMLGRFAEEGWATPRDPAAARDLYRRAAEGGDFRGACNHAQALREQGDRAGAAHWFARAAATGTLGFRRALAAGLAGAPEPELRAIARGIALPAIANDSQNHYQPNDISVSQA